MLNDGGSTNEGKSPNCHFLSTVKASGHPILGKLGSVYSVQYLLVIFLMVEPVGIITSSVLGVRNKRTHKVELSLLY